MRTGLRLRVEHGVAAALVGEHQVVRAPAVAQVQRVFFAGAPAVQVRVAGAQEARERAVLGVEDRQVLVRDRLQPCGPACAQGDALGRVLHANRDSMHSVCH